MRPNVAVECIQVAEKPANLAKQMVKSQVISDNNFFIAVYVQTVANDRGMFAVLPESIWDSTR